MMNDDLLKKFEEMKFSSNEDMTLNSRVLIVDGLNTFIRSFAAIPTMDIDGNHIGGITGFLRSIGYAIRYHKCTRCFVVFDGQGGSLRRKKIFPEYKAQRKPLTRLNRAYDMTTAKDEQEMMKYEMAVLSEILKTLPINILVFDHVEADDVMAYLAELVAQHDGDAILYSMDKDFLQLATDRIKIWNPIKKKLYDRKTIVDDYGIHPSNFLMYRIVQGDKSDNIDGIRGFGKKTILKHFPNLATDQAVTLDEMVEYGKDSKSKVISRLYEQQDKLERNIQLMQLSEVNMAGSQKLSVVDAFNELPPEFNKHHLTKLLLNYKLMDAMGNYNSWANSTFMPLTRFHD